MPTPQGGHNSVVFTCFAALVAVGLSPLQPKDPWAFGPNTVNWEQSPNCGRRPENVIVDTIVLHHTAGPTTASCVRTFLDTKSQVSSHYVVGKDGSIIQMVSTYARAWHAGKSTDAYGRDNVNHFSVGIEIVNIGDGVEPFTEPQLDALEHLVASIIRRFPIKQITSHEFIAEPQGRKDDPKGFPWERMKRFGLPLNFGLKPAK